MTETAQPGTLATIKLAAVLTAVTCARAFTKRTLEQCGLATLSGDAELVVSELVTNAVSATGITEPDPTWPDLAGVPLIEVRLRRFGRSLLIEVWDQDLKPPVMKEPDLDDEHGRGLFIVDALCHRWDCFYPRDGGKLVWAELAITLPTRVPPSRYEHQPRTHADAARQKQSGSWRAVETTDLQGG